MRRIKKIFDIIFIKVGLNLFCWIFVAPLSLILPKKKGSIVFLSRYNNSFGDNVKYFYYYVKSNKNSGIYPCAIIESLKQYWTIQRDENNVVYHPSLKSFYTLFRSQLAIVDSNEWNTRCKPQFLAGADVIQLWHGTGIKQVMLDNPRNKIKKSFIRRWYFRIRGSLVKYRTVLFTSPLQAERRLNMFFCDDYFINGQPRVDVLFRECGVPVSKYELDFICMLKEFRSRGKKILMYSPTWRKDSSSFFHGKEPVDYFTLNDFLEKRNMVLVLKYHPMIQDSNAPDNLSSVFLFNSRSDSYLIMKYVDLLVTDYSSIYLDFMLLNRPIVFFPYDYSDYVENKKKVLKEDYENLTPGLRCYNQDELEESIDTILIKGKDDFREARLELRDKIYTYADGESCKRLYTYLLRMI